MFELFDPKYRTLAGKNGLVLGIANRDSIAYGCAKAFKTIGAELALTYLNDKAKPYVEPIAEELEAPIFMPCDVQQEGQLESLFAAIQEKWGRLDFALHSIAFAPKEDLRGRLVDSSSAGFLKAMDVSCHSFVRMAKLAEPLMTDGGALFAMSFYGAAEGGEELQPHGPRQGGARVCRALSGLRAGPERNTCVRGLTGSCEDSCRLWVETIRRDVNRSR